MCLIRDQVIAAIKLIIKCGSSKHTGLQNLKLGITAHRYKKVIFQKQDL